MAVCKLIRVNHTGVTVADLATAAAFFRDVLGFEVTEPVEHGGESVARMVGVPGARLRIAFCTGGGHTVELIQYLQPPSQAARPRHHNECGFTHLALLVEDIGAAACALQDAGFEFFGEPQTVQAGPRKGGKNVYARDANGLVVELQQSPPR